MNNVWKPSYLDNGFFVVSPYMMLYCCNQGTYYVVNWVPGMTVQTVIL